MATKKKSSSNRVVYVEPDDYIPKAVRDKMKKEKAKKSGTTKKKK